MIRWCPNCEEWYHDNEWDDDECPVCGEEMEVEE